MNNISLERMAYGEHHSEVMCLYDPSTKKEDSPMVIILHGGFFKLKYGFSITNGLAKNLAEDGYFVANLEYPRVDEGLTAPQMLKSVFSAIYFLNRMTARPKVIIGHSAGGYYALMCALHDSNFMGTEIGLSKKLGVEKVIALAPLTDLWRGQQEGLSDDHDAIKLFIESEREDIVEEDYHVISPSNYNRFDCTVYIVHGDKDEDVPAEHSESFVKDRENVSFQELVDVDHYNVVDSNHDSWQKVKTLI